MGAWVRNCSKRVLDVLFNQNFIMIRGRHSVFMNFEVGGENDVVVVDNFAKFVAHRNKERRSMDFEFKLK
jgi:hypothetical protein